MYCNLKKLCRQALLQNQDFRYRVSLRIFARKNSIGVVDLDEEKQKRKILFANIRNTYPLHLFCRTALCLSLLCYNLAKALELETRKKKKRREKKKRKERKGRIEQKKRKNVAFGSRRQIQIMQYFSSFSVYNVSVHSSSSGLESKLFFLLFLFFPADHKINL